MKARLRIAAACLLISGCTATGPEFSAIDDQVARVPDGEARVFVFRTNESKLYLARKARILIDGVHVSELARGTFYFEDLRPGEHRFMADMWDAPGACEVKLDARPGQVYYLQADPREQSFWSFVGPASAADLLGQSFMFSVASGVGGMAAESYGNACGGAFRLYPVDEAGARERIANLRFSARTG